MPLYGEARPCCRRDRRIGIVCEYVKEEQGMKEVVYFIKTVHICIFSSANSFPSGLQIEDQLNNQPTNRQTDIQGHREVSPWSPPRGAHVSKMVQNIYYKYMSYICIFMFSSFVFFLNMTCAELRVDVKNGSFEGFWVEEKTKSGSFLATSSGLAQYHKKYHFFDVAPYRKSFWISNIQQPKSYFCYWKGKGSSETVRKLFSV